MVGQKKAPRFLEPGLGTEQDRATQRDGDNDLSPARNATKADDASVPAHLWTTQFLETAHPTWGEGRWTSADRAGLEVAMNTLRGRFLLQWQVRVRRSFFAWLRKARDPCGVHLTPGPKGRYVWNSTGKADSRLTTAFPEGEERG